MPKVAYIEKRFNDSTREIIDRANEIIEEYQADDLSLTLRQLYYQFVARGMIPNKQSEYNRLGTIISNARLAGHVDWHAIEDRTRNLQQNSHWADVGSIIRACKYSFMIDHWKDQPYRVEVWIEKEALAGVISTICEDLDVPYFACKGYVSQSEMWVSAQRLIRHAEGGQKPVIIHMGDHDPSGIDMTRDIIDRQDLFLGDVKVIRVALNMDQVEQYSPPPNPAKLTDTRANGYISKYGNESWELDALEPRVLRDLIADTVTEYRDQDVYDEILDEEQSYKDILDRIEANWQEL
jgi:hypothetical protein